MNIELSPEKAGTLFLSLFTAMVHYNIRYKLQPDLESSNKIVNDIYDLYVDIGGTHTLEEILSEG